MKIFFSKKSLKINDINILYYRFLPATKKKMVLCVA
jgi:hypothetical protein